jgi:hypothetical protein
VECAGDAVSDIARAFAAVPGEADDGSRGEQAKAGDEQAEVRAGCR